MYSTIIIERIFNYGGFAMPKNEFICDCHPIDAQLVENAKKAMPQEEMIRGGAHFVSGLGDRKKVRCAFAMWPMCFL